MEAASAMQRAQGHLPNIKERSRDAAAAFPPRTQLISTLTSLQSRRMQRAARDENSTPIRGLPTLRAYKNLTPETVRKAQASELAPHQA